jgi:hypothetical protein
MSAVRGGRFRACSRPIVGGTYRRTFWIEDMRTDATHAKGRQTRRFAAVT